MIWTIEFDKKVFKEIAALDKLARTRIASFLRDKLSKIENPRSIGEALHGQLKNFWKYRIGNYRLICKIEDETVTVLVLRIKHRREVYKKSF